MCHSALLFKCWIIRPCMDIIYPSIHWWTLRLLPPFACCASCFYKRGCANNSVPCFYFSRVYSPRWRCWIVHLTFTSSVNPGCGKDSQWMTVWSSDSRGSAFFSLEDRECQWQDAGYPRFGALPRPAHFWALWFKAALRCTPVQFHTLMRKLGFFITTG